MSKQFILVSLVIFVKTNYLINEPEKLDFLGSFLWLYAWFITSSLLERRLVPWLSTWSIPFLSLAGHVVPAKEDTTPPGLLW